MLTVYKSMLVSHAVDTGGATDLAYVYIPNLETGHHFSRIYGSRCSFMILNSYSSTLSAWLRNAMYNSVRI